MDEKVGDGRDALIGICGVYVTDHLYYKWTLKSESCTFLWLKYFRKYSLLYSQVSVYLLVYCFLPLSHFFLSTVPSNHPQ